MKQPTQIITSSAYDAFTRREDAVLVNSYSPTEARGGSYVCKDSHVVANEGNPFFISCRAPSTAPAKCEMMTLWNALAYGYCTIEEMAGAGQAPTALRYAHRLLRDHPDDFYGHEVEECNRREAYLKHLIATLETLIA